MRYYFNIVGTEEIPDPEGSEFVDEQLAQNEARVIVAELAREFPSRFGMGSALEVFNEGGRRVLALPIPS